MNLYAPPAINGLRQESGRDTYLAKAFDYVYDVTLTANQSLRDQIVAIQQDADFALQAILLASYTGSFQIRLSDSQGTYLSNGYLYSANFLSGGVPAPFAVMPEQMFPAGGRIGIDITDVSGSSNTVQILFRGEKRYRTANLR